MSEDNLMHDDWGVTRDSQINSNQLRKEADLRAKYPALKEAWERYQIILSLTMTQEDDE